MLERSFTVGPFQCNSRLLVCPATGIGALLDPGAEASRLLEAIRGWKTPSGALVRIGYLLHTHAHLDHAGATRELREALAQGGSAPEIWLHREDEPLYRALPMQARIFGLSSEDPLPVDRYLEEGQVLEVGRLRLSVLHTPGHSPGGVSFRLHEDRALGAAETVFSGDTLFQGSFGRTDLWGGDAALLLRSIRERLLVLDGDTRVCPGHGPDTSIAIEKRENPFLS
jgi:hydroxyacylglutathione hydrolase